MAEDKKTKETVQPEISVEQLQAENESLKTQLSESVEKLQRQEKEFNESFSKLSEENEQLKSKVSELSDVAVDPKSNRKENKKGEVQIKIVLSPAGRFLLPFNVGQTVWLNANQADELVECKYAEYVK